MVTVLLLSHLCDRRIIRLNIYLSLETVNNDRLSLIILLKSLSKPNNGGYPLRTGENSRVGINRPISCNESQHLRLIKLNCFTGIDLSRRQNKRLIHQHLIFECSGQNTQYTIGYVLDICIMPLDIILPVDCRHHDKLFCSFLNCILCVQFMFHYNIGDFINQIMVLQNHLLHLKNCRISFSDFFRRSIIKLF